MPKAHEPLISVIIPTYNRGAHVLNAVKTVEQQTHKNIETVVVIDGSTDNTRQILSDYRASLPDEKKDRLHILYQENKGVSAARNTGIKHAKGDYLAILDDDDHWEPAKLARQLNEVKKYPSNEPLLCTTDYNAIDAKSGASDIVKNADRMSLEGSMRLGFPPPSTWLFSRQTYNAVGGFDERLHAGEDADFVITLRKLDAHFVNVNQPLASYALPESGKTYRKEDDSALRTLQKHGVWYAATFAPDTFANSINWYERKIPQEGHDIIRDVRASQANPAIRNNEVNSSNPPASPERPVPAAASMSAATPRPGRSGS